MNKKKQIFLHAIIWIAILLFHLLVAINSSAIRHDAIVQFVFFGILNIAIFYINYLFILPGFLNRQRYGSFVSSIIGLVLIFGLIKYGLAYYFRDEVLMMWGSRVSFIDYYFRAMFTSAFFVFLSTAFKFSVDWFNNEKLRKNLEKEKLITELAFLRSQINPHFLLNSLNNIYSLAYRRSDKTPEAILKLSEIMSYMLYESNDKMVDISKEIQYLESYIELQKLRFAGASVKLEISEDGSNNTIVPLILIAFVENAFKHGVATDKSFPIEIKLHIKGGKLNFRVSNKKNTQNKDETGGIGLHNVKRRLELLYPGKYKLNIDDNADFYTSELTLDL